MKRRRIVPVRTERRLRAAPPADAAEGEMLPIGRVPADDARDDLMLQQLAWQSTWAGDAGLAWVAIVAVVVGIRAVVVNLAAWIIRGIAGHARPRRGARPRT